VASEGEEDKEVEEGEESAGWACCCGSGVRRLREMIVLKWSVGVEEYESQTGQWRGN